MTRDEILEEIRRIAGENDGVPPGKRRFADLTGVVESDWSGRFWARWSDVLLEAGLEPNKMQGAYPDSEVLDKLICYIEELGKLPTIAELHLKRRSDPEFPSAGVFARLGRKAELAARVLQRCEELEGHEAARSICAPLAQGAASSAPAAADSGLKIGAVYLMKSGANYKIGRTNAVGRREYEFAIQLPDEVKTIHVIRTDDPVGVEVYWHQRFAARRKRGEWFDLTRADVRAFKRWKSIV